MTVVHAIDGRCVLQAEQLVGDDDDAVGIAVGGRNPCAEISRLADTIRRATRRRPPVRVREPTQCANADEELPVEEVALLERQLRLRTF